MPPEKDGSFGRFADRIRWLLATGLGLGYLPLAPGTFGSVPGVVLAWSLWTLGGSLAVGAGFLLITGLGYWAAEGAGRWFERRDPGQVVVDETAGQMLALLFVPPTARALVAGFVLFRAIDVIKPFPLRRLEHLPRGIGIMADDLAAGAYANLLLQGAMRLLPGLVGPP